MNPEELKQKMKDRYSVFCQVLQDDGWFDPMHQTLCDWIQNQIATTPPEKDVKLGIIMPRGSLKSTIVTKYLSIWFALRDPNVRILIATNTYPNARKKIEDVRGVFDAHPVYRALFPETLPTKHCRWTNEAAELPRTMAFPEATFEGAGMKTRKIGTHYNVLIEDDTVAPDESDLGVDLCTPSMEIIDGAIGWHKAATALMVPKGQRVRIIVTTRWADEDVVDYIKRNEDYRFFDVPAMDSADKPIFSMFYSADKLADIRSQIGPYMFSCLYLNKPIDASLRVFKSEWFHWVDPEDIPESDPEKKIKAFYAVSIDPAISEKEESCETAITGVIHVQDNKKSYEYWRDVLHGHFDLNRTVLDSVDLAQRNNAKYIIVETNAYQAALKYSLQDELTRRNLRINIIPVQARTKKEIRIEGLVPYFANARILLVRGLPPQVESQLKQFPHGKLVDIVDAFSLHRQVAGMDLRADIVRPKEKIADPNSGEEILKQVRASYEKRVHGLGVLAEERPLEMGIPTGLGRNIDMELTMRRFAVR